MSWQRADKRPHLQNFDLYQRNGGANRSWVHRHTSPMQRVIGNLSWVKTGRRAEDVTWNKERYPWPAGVIVGSKENCVSILCYRGTEGALKRAKYCWMCLNVRVTMSMLTGEQPKIKDGGAERKLEVRARQKSIQKLAQARRPPVCKHTLSPEMLWKGGA